MVELSIVVLVFNTEKLIEGCIKSLIGQYKAELEQNIFEIIVVDNASMDNSIRFAKNALGKIKNKKSFTILENKENFGFSKGNNIGAKRSKGKYILFLNSDTIVEDRGFLEMVRYLKNNKDVGILGAKMKNQDGSEQPSVGVFYNLPNVFAMLFGWERLGMFRSSPNHIKSVDWVSGASMMVKKELFEKFGGFDENFFMYVEDMEICFRVKKSGLLVNFFPNIKISHVSHGSSNRKFAIVNIYKGLLYFYKKHKSFWQYIILRCMLLTKALISIAAGILSGNKNLIDTYSNALKISI